MFSVGFKLMCLSQIPTIIQVETLRISYSEHAFNLSLKNSYEQYVNKK